MEEGMDRMFPTITTAKEQVSTRKRYNADLISSSSRSKQRTKVETFVQDTLILFDLFLEDEAVESGFSLDGAAEIEQEKHTKS